MLRKPLLLVNSVNSINGQLVIEARSAAIGNLKEIVYLEGQPVEQNQSKRG